jgi:hypothetical protein
MNSEIIREVIEYKERRIYVIFLFLFLLLLPFAFAIESYMELRTCQGTESNGCPSMSLPAIPDAPQNSVVDGSQELHVDIATGRDVQKIV